MGKLTNISLVTHHLLRRSSKYDGLWLVQNLKKNVNKHHHIKLDPLDPENFANRFIKLTNHNMCSSKIQ